MIGSKPRLGLLGAALLCTLSQPGGAETTTPDPATLATAEATVNFCAAVNPMLTDKLRARLSELTQGTTEQQLTEIRNSKPYQEAYRAVQSVIAQADESAAARLCADPPARSS